MSNSSSDIGPEGCGVDTAACALGALSEDEERAVDRHVVTCAICADELAVFRAAVDALAESPVQYRAPEGLGDRVKAAVRRDAAQRSHARRARWRSRSTLGRSIRPALALCTLAIAAVLIIGVARHPSAHQQVRVLSAAVIGAPGWARLRIASGHGELVVHRLPAPPAGETYEVWLDRPGHGPQPTSALFNVTTRGDADVDVPGSLAHVAGIMVTAEPAGGTRAPTHPAVISARLS